MAEMGPPFSGMELASFMSCSKGYMGECGMRCQLNTFRLATKLFLRGGYAEVVNMDDDVMALLQKSISAKLCPTVLGQACMDIVANPPKPGEPSYDSWLQEKEVRLVTKARRNNPNIQGNLASLARRAELVATTLNTIPGFSCNTVQGAMYAFPKIFLPPKVGLQQRYFLLNYLPQLSFLCLIGSGCGFGGWSVPRRLLCFPAAGGHR